MFKDVGPKIQLAAKILTIAKFVLIGIVDVVLLIVGLFQGLFKSFSIDNFYASLIFVIVMLIVNAVYIFLAWLFGALLHGFGEIVNNTTTIAKKTASQKRTGE